MDNCSTNCRVLAERSALWSRHFSRFWERESDGRSVFSVLTRNCLNRCWSSGESRIGSLFHSGRHCFADAGASRWPFPSVPLRSSVCGTRESDKPMSSKSPHYRRLLAISFKIAKSSRLIVRLNRAQSQLIIMFSRFLARKIEINRDFEQYRQ